MKEIIHFIPYSTLFLSFSLETPAFLTRDPIRAYIVPTVDLP